MNAVELAREHAQNLFEKIGLPTARDEHWKYTDASRFASLIADAAAPIASEKMDTDALGVVGIDAYRMTFINGVFDASASILPDGVSILSLAGLLGEINDESAEAVAKLYDVSGDEALFSGFTALNAAKALDGAAVCIADHTQLDKPLYILHIANQGYVIRHGMMLGEHAEAEVIEHYISVDSAALSHASSHVILKAGAHLQHYHLQQEAAKQSHIGRIEVKQLRDSSYQLHAVELGSILTRLDVAIALAEQGASCDLNGLFVLDGRQHVDHHTRVDHQAPHCVSREHYRTVLSGRSHGVFNGKVVVHAGAVKTDSKQSNANLLLSDKAEIDTKPELEIYNDDVKCAHGATVGQLDDTQLFYLRSRGVSEEAAKELLTLAFADEVLAAMGNADVRRYIEKAAFAKLPHEADIDELLV